MLVQLFIKRDEIAGDLRVQYDGDHSSKSGCERDYRLLPPFFAACSASCTRCCTKNRPGAGMTPGPWRMYVHLRDIVAQREWFERKPGNRKNCWSIPRSWLQPSPHGWLHRRPHHPHRDLGSQENPAKVRVIMMDVTIARHLFPP